MKKRCVFLLLVSFFVIFKEKVSGQISIGGVPASWGKNDITERKLKEISFPVPDFEALEKEDLEDEKGGVPPRFGFMNKTKINLLSSEFKSYEAGDIITWKAVFYCPKALSINFVFDQFWLPEGGKLFIYSADRKHLIGAFTSQNNKGSRKELRGFATGLVYGDEVVLEYEESLRSEKGAIINISGVVHGYRNIRVPNNIMNISNFGFSGPCQVNVNCQEGSNWQNEKRGVAMIVVDGVRNCTGSLINNTSNNGELLFLTANHCLVDRDATINPIATDWSFWWDYESPSCNNPSSEPLSKVTNGATILANNGNSDFALLKLSESPFDVNPPVNIYFNGWDRTNDPPIGGVGLHHPRGDLKKISTYDISPISNPFCTGQIENYWQVNWVETTNGFSVMQPSSSGSPLITSDRKIIGQLYGPMGCPNIQCNDPANQNVVYGRLSVSWTGSGANTNRLSNWLDPGNTGVTNVDGIYFNNCPQQVLINFPINVQGEFQAVNKITASSTIASGANVSMKAENSIEFDVGFGASAGSKVAATIGICSPKVIQPPSRKAVDYFPIANLEMRDSEFNIFPNPGNGKFSMALNVLDEGKVVYRITNLLGQEVFAMERIFTETGSHIVEANLDPLPSGVYLVTVLGENFQMNKRIIKQ